MGEPVTDNTETFQRMDNECMDKDSSTDDESDDLDCCVDDPDWEYDAYESDDDEVEKEGEPTPSKRQVRYMPDLYVL